MRFVVPVFYYTHSCAQLANGAFQFILLVCCLDGFLRSAFEPAAGRARAAARERRGVVAASVLVRERRLRAVASLGLLYQLHADAMSMKHYCISTILFVYESWLVRVLKLCIHSSVIDRLISYIEIRLPLIFYVVF